MAYEVRFKNKYTKGKWIGQEFIYSTKSMATNSGKGMIAVDPRAGTKIKIRKVDGRKDPRPVHYRL